MRDPWVQEGGPGEIQHSYTCFYEQVSVDSLRNPEKPQFQKYIWKNYVVPGKGQERNKFPRPTMNSYLLARKSQFIGAIEGIQLLLGGKCGYSAHKMGHTNTWYLNS